MNVNSLSVSTTVVSFVPIATPNAVHNVDVCVCVYSVDKTPGQKFCPRLAAMSKNKKEKKDVHCLLCVCACVLREGIGNAAVQCPVHFIIGSQVTLFHSSDPFFARGARSPSLVSSCNAVRSVAGLSPKT